MEFMKATIKSCDMFGLPVSLTYRGESRFKTAIGGCTSLIIILVAFFGAAYQLKSLIEEPVFQALPPEIDYSASSFTMDFTSSSIAVGVRV